MKAITLHGMGEAPLITTVDLRFVGSWLQLSRYGTALVVFCCIIARMFRIADEQTHMSADYALQRAWIISRAAYWDLCLKTFILLVLVAVSGAQRPG